MGRWIRVLVATLTVCSGLILGTVNEGHARSVPAVEPSARLLATLLVYPSGRAHPEGPDSDDPPTRARPAYSQLAARVWTGAGRHPVWRGCQHVYDPKLGKFIFAAAP